MAGQTRKPLAFESEVSVSISPIEIKTFLMTLAPGVTIEAKPVPTKATPNPIPAAEIPTEPVPVVPVATQGQQVIARIGNMEVKTMLLFTTIGVFLIVVIYLRLSRGRRKLKVSPLNK